MLRKVFNALFLFCTLWNVTTALPPRTVVTTKWPSLTSSNPKCPTIPLWKDLKPTIQDLTAKNLLPPEIQLKLLKTLDEQIKNCEDKIAELEAEDIEKKNDDESNTNVEIDKQSNTNDEEVANDENIDETQDIYEITGDLEEDPGDVEEDPGDVAEDPTVIEQDPTDTEKDNEDDEPEKVNITKIILPTTTETPHEIKSLVDNLPSFIPIFKPRAVVTARRINVSQNSKLAAKENSKNKSEDKQEHTLGNNVIIQLTKSSKSEPVVNTFEAKQVSNGTNPGVKIVNAHKTIVLETPKSTTTKPLASVSSTTIPRTNIIHLNTNNHQSVPPNYAFVINPGSVPTYVISAENNPSKKPPSHSVSQAPGPVTPVASAAPCQGIAVQDYRNVQNVPLKSISENPATANQIGSYPVNSAPLNANCNSVSLNTVQNYPCSNSVPANIQSISNSVPVTTSPLAPFNSLAQNVISSNASPYSFNTFASTSNSCSRNVASPSQCSCSLFSNHVSPVPLKSSSNIPSKSECKEINRKCIERAQRPNVVFFKPEDVEVLNVQGDLLKKMKMTVLVPTYVSQLDV